MLNDLNITNSPLDAHFDISQDMLMEYLYALGIFVVLYLALRLLRWLVLHKLQSLTKRTKTDMDDLIIDVIEKIKQPYYLYLAFFVSSRFIPLDPFIDKTIMIALVAWSTYQAILCAEVVTGYFVNKFSEKEKGEDGSRAAYEMLGRLVNLGLWGLGILLVLSNLGINITSLIAGLGIGGIAIALAAQNVLGDLFSAFAIYLDKPFVVGDFIIVGDKMGVVEKIGIKTTRIRALQGEQIVISNQDLMSARIQNFKQMQKRRVVFSFGVLYETTQDKMKKIPGIVKEIIEKQKETVFDRAHFFSFDDSALTYEVVYYVDDRDYNKYMDIQQTINLELKEKLEKEGVSMAYPTRTIYLKKE